MLGPFADMLKFPRGFQCIIEQVTLSQFCFETRDVDFGDYAFKILKELERFDEKDALLENVDGRLFFKAVLNRAAESDANK